MASDIPFVRRVRRFLADLAEDLRAGFLAALDMWRERLTPAVTPWRPGPRACLGWHGSLTCHSMLDMRISNRKGKNHARP